MCELSTDAKRVTPFLCALMPALSQRRKCKRNHKGIKRDISFPYALALRQFCPYQHRMEKDNEEQRLREEKTSRRDKTGTNARTFKTSGASNS